ncbi:6144_t:CDS:2 [Acaulospora morrowiae]|uniref:6144_t:CDS:1 n=1 Tax=Acaulospora morrowiae TaxID=94023 RepID=A0A9N9ECT8_9GLOM|nr:6144_t:CDS:2 [Acaulospora morrowiae]
MGFGDVVCGPVNPSSFSLICKGLINDEMQRVITNKIIMENRMNSVNTEGKIPITTEDINMEDLIDIVDEW